MDGTQKLTSGKDIFIICVSIVQTILIVILAIWMGNLQSELLQTHQKQTGMIEKEAEPSKSQEDTIQRETRGLIGTKLYDERAFNVKRYFFSEAGLKGEKGEKGETGDCYMEDSSAGTNNVRPPIRPTDETSPIGIFTRWGRQTCGLYGTVLFSGYAVGINGAEKNCIESQSTFSENAAARKFNGEPMLKDVVFAHYGIYPDESQGFWTDIDGKILSCAVCTAMKSATIVQYGADSCKDGWVKLYQGFVMAELSTTHSSSPVCVDARPEMPTLTGLGSSEQVLEITFVSKGTSAFDIGKPIKCVVCGI